MSAGVAGAVVVGGSVNGLGVVRSLAEHGIRTDLVVTHPSDIAQHSRVVGEVCVLPGFSDDPESLIDLLERRAARWSGWAILPTHDHALAALSQNFGRLERWYPRPAPPWEITRRLLDKQVIAGLARELGIDTPRAYGPATPATAARPLDFPVLVKPRQGHVFWQRFGKKLFAAGNRKELLAAVASVQAAGLAADVVDCIPGDDGQIYQYAAYVDGRAEAVAEFALRKLRQAPPHYGVARAAETVSAPQLREPTLELLRRLDWRGIAAVEYKLDPRDGRYRLLDVNGRSFLTNRLARRAGVNLPLLAWREQVRRERVGARSNGWRGVWLHLHADLLYTALCAAIEPVGWREFGRSYLRPKTFAVWSARDPKPFLAQWTRTFGTVSRAAGDRRERALIRGRVQTAPGMGPT